MLTVQEKGKDWFANEYDVDDDRNGRDKPLLGIELSIPIYRDDADDDGSDNNHDEENSGSDRDIDNKSNETKKCLRKSRSVLRQVTSGQRSQRPVTRSTDPNRGVVAGQADNIQQKDMTSPSTESSNRVNEARKQNPRQLKPNSSSSHEMRGSSIRANTTSANVRRNRSSTSISDLNGSSTHSQTNAVSFFKLLDLDPSKQRQKLDEEKFLDIISKDPSLCSKRYDFLLCPGDSIFPLHMLCAIGASLNAVKYCFKTYPDAIFEVSNQRLLTCLHFTVLYARAPVDVVTYIIKKDRNAVHSLSRKKQTPLHLACSCPTSVKVINPDVVVALTDVGQEEGCMELDKYGRTPLHVACGLETPCLEIIENLTEVNNAACLAQCYEYNSTPLHIACSNVNVSNASHAVVDVVKDLIRSCPESVKVTDKDGQLPIYVAITNKACLKVIKLLVRKYPECRGTVVRSASDDDSDKILLHELASKRSLDPTIIEFLLPYKEEEDDD